MRTLTKIGTGNTDFDNGSLHILFEKGVAFQWVGLDSGVYTVKETKTPPGYNTVPDITFEIVAVYDTEADNPELKSLVIKYNGVTSTDLNTGISQETIDEAQAQLEAGEITDDEFAAVIFSEVAKVGFIHCPECKFVGFNVVNNSGATLPTTGGIGTTIFYVAGLILVLGAGVLLVTRRRMVK